MKVFRLIFLILHVGIFILLLGVLMNSFVPPKVFPWFNLLSLGFPVLISAYIFLIFFWIVSWKKRAFVFLLLGLLFFKPVVRWVNFSSKKEVESDLKIVSLNTKGGKLGVDEIQDYINRQNADLIFLQEDGEVDYQFNGLKKEKKISIVSLYSKFRVIDYKDLQLYQNFNAFADRTDIEIKGKTYRFINIYLQPFKFEKNMVKLNGNSEDDEVKVKNIVKRLIPNFKDHQDQIEIIKKEIDNSPYPVFVIGDFNAVPNSYEYYKVSEDLKDTFVEVGRGSGTSFHDFKFPLRIDYVFTSKSIQPVSYKVDRNVQISDHFPVITTFKIAD
ncbi:endonuclease/exonuclease/phosphatase family protein [Chryseobacterium camelliae]|uniref:Endonuclease/exonuclease/phosphatase family protein n=1 Tax=Chryseobacterium camelliae TaxID=1265445 RepID=A0ABY7QHW4_9FLAO|nr:endonuclease/exonuclease/phosphatase family protein [Chryseobacterium camelliae]WBV59238.1 endonuclease/exonuclease/phosphatase family protein [Chryseobacterium camelliae]